MNKITSAFALLFVTACAPTTHTHQHNHPEHFHERPADTVTTCTRMCLVDRDVCGVSTWLMTEVLTAMKENKDPEFVSRLEPHFNDEPDLKDIPKIALMIPSISSVPKYQHCMSAYAGCAVSCGGAQ